MHRRARNLSLDTNYIRIGTVTVKTVNLFRMQIEYVAEYVREKCTTAKVSGNMFNGAAPPGN